MSLNIAGVVITKNYNNQLPELEKVLGEKLHFEEEVWFEEALESWKSDAYCDIYFGENFTFLLVDYGRGGFEIPVPEHDSFSFILSEDSDVYSIHYCKDEKVIRAYTFAEGEVKINEGKTLVEELEANDIDNILRIFQHLTQLDFEEMDPEETFYRYRFEANEEEVPTRPWWKFW